VCYCVVIGFMPINIVRTYYYSALSVFPRKNDVRFVFTSISFVGDLYFIYVTIVFVFVLYNNHLLTLPEHLSLPRSLVGFVLLDLCF
jgi:hypothetical protein